MADNEKTREKLSIGQILIKILITIVVVGLAAFFTPGFTIDGLGTLIFSGVVIAIVDYLISRFTGVDASPFGRGLTGFIITAAILYLTRYLVQGFNISVLGAILGALAIGIIDAIIPGDAF